MYHLQGPRIFLNSGKILPLADIWGANGPFTIEMLYMFGLRFGSDTFAKLLHMSYAILLVMSTFTFGRRFLGWGGRLDSGCSFGFDTNIPGVGKFGLCRYSLGSLRISWYLRFDPLDQGSSSGMVNPLRSHDWVCAREQISCAGKCRHAWPGCDMGQQKTRLEAHHSKCSCFWWYSYVSWLALVSEELPVDGKPSLPIIFWRPHGRRNEFSCYCLI